MQGCAHGLRRRAGLATLGPPVSYIGNWQNIPLSGVKVFDGPIAAGPGTTRF